MDQHTTLVGVINRRMNSIKVILNWWNKGNITSAVNALSMMNDTSVIMDVLNNTFADNQRIDMLNYENIAAILPHATMLVNSKYETHIQAGLKSSLNILKSFGPQIIQLKTVPVASGVDLAREERIRKCDQCIELFYAFFKSKGF
jgi:con80 domain of Katanin